MAGDGTTGRTQTGSMPAITVERAAPPPSPPPPKKLSEEWAQWVELRLEWLAHELGWPPIPAKEDPGYGVWRSVEQIRVMCEQILRRIDAADKLSEKRGGWAARVGWKALEVFITTAVLAGLAWLSGWHR